MKVRTWPLLLPDLSLASTMEHATVRHSGSDTLLHEMTLRVRGLSMPIYTTELFRRTLRRAPPRKLR
jgi:hypothetical protein